MKSNKLRCVVIEDELPTQQWLVNHLHEFSEIEVVGTAQSVEKAFQLIKITQPDAAFLDIKLIGGDGFTVLKRLKDNGIDLPYIVITTGYVDYAIQAINEFSAYVVKYILKPYVDDYQIKLRDAIDALLIACSNTNAANIAPALGQEDFIFVRTNEGYTRVDFADIKYIEAAGEGSVYIVTDYANPCINQTLTKCLDGLPQFIKRISKFNAVSIRHIKDINKADRTLTVVCKGKPISLGIGDIYYIDLLKVLGVK